MLRQRPILYFLLLVLLLSLFACSGTPKKQDRNTEQKQTTSSKPEVNAKAKMLLATLNEMGDYVNSRNFPSLIKPSAVYEELASNIHIIDIRGKNTFANGHISGAVRVDFSDLPDYFTNSIKPFEYDKIILVCYSGQISSYATCLLRLEGYGNVYSMRWGMSGWNRDFAEDFWLANLSSNYQDQLETKDVSAAPAADLPKLNEEATSGEELLQKRVSELFSEGYEDALITADEVFDDPAAYYIINYERKDKYESGHIPGAVRYKPGATAGIVSEMQTIPAQSEVVVYCTTGHNSSFITAYLRLFGYDAKTLTFGNNAFMYDKMKEEESSLSWLPFTEAEIENYPYQKN